MCVVVVVAGADPERGRSSSSSSSGSSDRNTYTFSNVRWSDSGTKNFSRAASLSSSRSFGRKNTLLLANFFVFLSSAFMYLGTVWWVLVLGRVSIGVVAGVAQMVAGSYMTEISPIGVRGSVGVCSQVGIVLGISLASFLTAPSFAVFGTIDRWRYTFLVPCVSSISSSAC